MNANQRRAAERNWVLLLLRLRGAEELLHRLGTPFATALEALQKAMEAEGFTTVYTPEAIEKRHRELMELLK